MTLQQLVGVSLPIVEAPMAEGLAVAVSSAGALGSVSCAMLGSDAMRQVLRSIEAQTGKPFNVHSFLYATSLELESAWRAALSP